MDETPLTAFHESQEPGNPLTELHNWAHNFFYDDKIEQFAQLASENPTAYPEEYMRHCARVGLLATEISETYGGEPMGPIEQVIVMKEAAKRHGGLALQLLVQNSLTAFPIAHFGTEDQKARYLPRMAKGELFACFGLTEPDVGSDAKNIQLKARWDEDREGWIVNGAKRFITGANGAGVIILAARTGAADSREHGISVFATDFTPGKNGVAVREYKKIGQSGSPLCEIFFDDFFVPKDALMGKEHEGWGIIESTLHHSRSWIAAQGLGITEAAYEEAMHYANERTQFGRKLAEIPDLINHRAIIERQIEIARFLVFKSAWHEMQGDSKAYVWASLAKLIACESAPWAAQESMLLHGGMGYTSEMSIGRVWLDSPVLRIYEGAAHIQIKILEKNGITREQLLGLFPPAGAMLLTPEQLPSSESVIENVATWELS